MKKSILIFCLACLTTSLFSTTHTVFVWDGYFQFISFDQSGRNIEINLGDTVEWRKLDDPRMVHTITSTNIPVGADPFDQIWQMPADTFFRYVPKVAGLYEYVCTPHETSHNMVGSINVKDPTSSTHDVVIQETLFYPNPSSGVLNFNSELRGTSYQIVDLNGREVETGILQNKLDISHLSTGSYVIRIESDKIRIRRIQKI